MTVDYARSQQTAFHLNAIISDLFSHMLVRTESKAGQRLVLIYAGHGAGCGGQRVKIFGIDIQFP